MRRTTARRCPLGPWGVLVAGIGVAAAFASAAPGFAAPAEGTPLAWVEQLRSDDADTRVAAGLSLARMRPPAPGVVEALTQLLDDPSWMTRNIALSALKQIGPDAREAFPAINRALDDENKRVQSTAALALKAVGAHSREDRLALVPRLSGGDRRMRLLAMQVVAESGADDVVPELTTLCHHEDAEVRRSAVGLLFALDAEVAGPIALELLEDEDGEVWSLAAASLRVLDPSVQAAAVPILARRLEDPRHYGAALAALRAMGPAAEPALPALLAMLERSRTSTPVAPRVVAAIAAVGPPARVALPRFREMLGEARLVEGSGQHRAALVEAIRDLAGQDDPALHAYAVRCARGLASADVMTRSASLNALIHLGPAAEPARDVLRDTLRDDPEPKYRQYAARALAAMQGKARPALPDLREAEQDENERVREEASAAIAKIDASPVTAIASLPPIEPLAVEDRAQIVVRRYLAGELEGRRGSQQLLEIGPAASPYLHRALLHEELSERQRAQIIDMLGWLGDEGSVEVVLQFASAHPEQPGYQLSALWALVRLPPTPAARSAVDSIAADPEAPARHRAAALVWYAEHRDAGGRVWVERYREDPDPTLRLAALYLAAFLGDATASGPLADMLNDPAYRSERDEVLSALAEIVGPDEFEALVVGRKHAAIDAARQMVSYRAASEAERRAAAPRLILTRDMQLRQLVVRDRIAAGDLATFEPLLEHWPHVSDAVRATLLIELRRAGYEIAERERRFIIRKAPRG